MVKLKSLVSNKMFGVSGSLPIKLLGSQHEATLAHSSYAFSLLSLVILTHIFPSLDKHTFNLVAFL